MVPDVLQRCYRVALRLSHSGSQTRDHEDGVDCGFLIWYS